MDVISDGEMMSSIAQCTFSHRINQATQEANAAFIVRAVNAHDALIAALQSMSDIARVKYGNLDPDANKVFEQAQTAIKLAETT